jgi:hypothetical protein
LAQEERPVRSDVEETNLPLISFYSSHIVTTCLSIMQTDKWFKRGNRQNKSSIYVTFWIQLRIQRLKEAYNGTTQILECLDNSLYIAAIMQHASGRDWPMSHTNT